MEDAREPSCREVLGGNRRIDRGLRLSDLEVWLVNRPVEGAEEGGDLVFLSVCGRGRVSKAYLADVAGHGPVVAPVARALRDLVREHLNDLDSVAFLQGLNRHSELFGERFATMVTVAFDRSADRLLYAYAGHPHLLFKARDSADFRFLEPDHCPLPGVRMGMAIGMVSGVTYRQTSISFREGDMVVLFSDGWTDAPLPAGGRAGQEGLRAAANRCSTESAGAFREDLFRRFEELGTGAFRDDVSLVVLRRTTGAPTPGSSEA